ncbi:MAG: hypothetical protein GY719_29945 [bacterium]|nr:hypothetical protein [bacterium]
MRRTYAITILFTPLFLTAPASSQNTVLNQVTRWWNASATNHMLSVYSGETNGVLEGQSFYISRSSQPGTRELFRLFSLVQNDHMTSVLTNEGGYALDGSLGHAFVSPGPGMEPMNRWFKTGVDFDHLVASYTEDPSPLGYVLEGTLGFGYPRFGPSCELSVHLDGAEVRLTANRVAGAAISGLTWNGKQLVNNFDYGRQIQTAFNFTNVGEEDNPTEAGSRYGCPGVVAAMRAQGSPVEQIAVQGSVLTTRSRPLQWNPENHGGDADHPVMWNGAIEKRIELDYQGHPRHIKWTTTLDVPVDRAQFDWEAVTAYLTADLDRLYAFDATADTLVDRSADVPNNGCLEGGLDPNLAPTSGGVILATANGQYALGAYRRKTTRNHFALCKFHNGAGNGVYDADTTKWSVLERDGIPGITAGRHSATVFLAVGTLSDVRASMLAFHQDMDIFSDGFESGTTGAWTTTAPLGNPKGVAAGGL